MKSLAIILVTALLSAFAADAAEGVESPKRQNRGFVHPGGIHSSADFKRVKRQLAEGNEKVKSAFGILCASPFSQPNAGPWPVEWIIRGGGVGENYMNAARGAAVAYQNALRWHLEDNEHCARHAVEVLMHWANVTKGIGGNSNYALASGIYGYQFAQAAELMRDWQGWDVKDFRRFQAWMLKVWYPPAIGFLRGRNGSWENGRLWWRAPGTYWSNWGLANALCVISIGILCDDVFIYNQGMSFIKHDQCGTFKDPREGDVILNDGLTEFMGNFVVTVHDSELETGAYGKLGQLNESGRDAGHSAMSLGLMLDIAKCAWHQGDDLFSFMDHRLAAGIEYLAAQTLGVEGLPWTKYHYCDSRFHYIDNRSWLMTGPVLGAHIRPYWGTVIGIYEGVKGVRMSFSRQAYERMGVDGGGWGPTSGGYDHLGFSVLMNTRDVQLAPPSRVPTELKGRIVYDGETLEQNELGGLKNTFLPDLTTCAVRGKLVQLIPVLPKGEKDTGKWKWNTGAVSRTITVKIDRSCIYRAIYTNSKGVKSALCFPIAVEGDCLRSPMGHTIFQDGKQIGEKEAEIERNSTVTLNAWLIGGFGSEIEWSTGAKGGSITLGNIKSDIAITASCKNQGSATCKTVFKLHCRQPRERRCGRFQ